MIAIRTIRIDPADGRIDPADYATVAAWWHARAAEPPPRTILPTLGVIAEKDGRPAAASFAYLDATGSGVALIGWMVTDPALRRITAGRALRMALSFLDEECARLNYWLSWATISAPSFISFLEKRGYKQAEGGLCHLFKPLHPAQPLN